MSKSKAGIKTDHPALCCNPLAEVQIIAIEKEPAIGQTNVFNHVARQEEPYKCGKLDGQAIAASIGSKLTRLFEGGRENVFDHSISQQHICCSLVFGMKSKQKPSKNW